MQSLRQHRAIREQLAREHQSPRELDGLPSALGRGDEERQDSNSEAVLKSGQVSVVDLSKPQFIDLTLMVKVDTTR